MRVFVLSLFVGVALALPQGYEYPVHLGPSDNNEFTLDQFQLLQQFADQQQQFSPQQFQLPAQAQVIAIRDNAPEVAAQSQTVTHTEESGGYQFANQLVQQSQIAQIAQHEQQQQQHVAAVPEVHTGLLATQLQDDNNSQQQQQQQQTQLSQQTPHHKQQQQQQQVEQQLLQQQQPLAQPQPEQLSAQQQQEQQQQTQLPQAQPLIEAKQQQQPLVQYTPPLLPPPAPAAAPIQPHYLPAPLQYNKEFYYLSAPQEDYDQSPELQSQLGKLKKNLRVLFIKAPEQNGLEKAALQLAQSTNSAQTAIYVLTKQHDVAQLANKLQQVRASSHARPEVVFVKYRTPAEAEHAQRTIQAQYEALEGPNHFNHDGVVPSHNFIGSTDVAEPRKRPAEEVTRPVSKYLPAAAKL